jgi:hypothetical protein
MVAGEALDVIGRQIAQLFHHTAITCRFFLLPLDVESLPLEELLLPPLETLRITVTHSTKKKPKTK